MDSLIPARQNLRVIDPIMLNSALTNGVAKSESDISDMSQKGSGFIGKRSLEIAFEEGKGNVDVNNYPPKRMHNGHKDNLCSISTNKPVMAITDLPDDFRNSSSSSAGSSSSSPLSGAPVANSVSGGTSTSHERDVDYMVALYGCSGYGELALKLNSALPSASLAESGNGNLGIVDNQALWLWDEDAETVLLAWAVMDVKLNKVLAVEQRLVRPTKTDGTLLTESFVAESGLSGEEVRNAESSLETVLQELSESVRMHTSGKVVTATLGPELLRQQIIPECSRRRIRIPDFMYSYFDVLSEYGYHWVPPHARQLAKLLKGIVENNQLSPEDYKEYGKRQVAAMISLLQFMIQNGQDVEVETILKQYETGLCKADVVADDCVVKARGLPWQASDLDVSKFFVGLDIPRGGIALCLSSHGRRNGEAIITFTSSRLRDMALQRHRHHMQNRYIEVYRTYGEDFQQVAGVCNSEIERFLKRDAGVIIRMRGLPYDATATQIIEFFAASDKPVTVVDGEEGVMFVKKPDGRATGDAFVLFKTEADGQIATSKHRQCIGSRYIELFRSTAAEVQQVLCKTQENRSDNQTPLIATSPMLPGLASINTNLLLQSQLLSGHLPTAKKTCIRLRGLPFEATVDDILDFLGEHAKQIVVHGVHMVYNQAGQPSGEAFIQLNNEAAATKTAADRHNRYMNMSKYNKKNRYIEVYQCSPDEMNGTGMSALGMQNVRPLGSPGFGGMAINPNMFMPAMSLPLGLPQLAAGFRSPLSGLLSMPAWYQNASLPPSAFPGSLLNSLSSQFIPNLSAPSFVHLRNIPYQQATGADVSLFLQGLVNPEAVQIGRHADGRPNGEAYVMFNSRADAERVVQERNRQMLGNRSVDMSVVL